MMTSSRPPSPSIPKRPPLLPSEQNGPPLPRRPKSRDVTSRYLSNSTSSVSSTLTSSSNTTSSSSSFNSVCTPRRRFPSSSPVVTPVRKGALSAERRRPGTPVVSAAAKMLMTATPSARSLSVSFQGESFKMPVKAKPAPNGSRCGTPDKRAVTPVRKVGNVIATPKTIDQQRWPARSRQGGFMTRSVDFSNENVKLSGSVRDLQKSRNSERKMTSTRPDVLEVRRSVEKVVGDCDNNSDRTVSDAESVSSGSIRGVTPRAIVVPPRFRQEPINRLRKVQPEPVSPPLSRNSKLLSGNRYLREGPTLSPRGKSPSPVRGAVRPASPVRGAVRPASPVKGVVRPASPNKSVPFSSALSPSRGMASPTRVRSGVGVTSNLGNAPSILNFAAETRRRKVGDNAVADAHVLRMLHNKYLQWRFANARADAAMLVQRSAAEVAALMRLGMRCGWLLSSDIGFSGSFSLSIQFVPPTSVMKCLYNSWVTTSKMRQSVMSKQIEIQQLRQNLKLYTVLKNQTPYLKVWDQGERDHTVSLSGTILSLESSTLRLPLVDGSKADLPSLKDAMRSAADVMQTMVSSIRSSVSKVR
ncbi:QWRF motif-containing protein 2-like protein [Tanacetum coccineum]|uniref:QWRF motif-containing protein 2-like protein n=1 Tax=Tanacetum coccineum TaxID=301880 RepID=A0ABQ5I7J3_9ASTR